uniref:AMP-activated protein kinase glycogen-binding domain-containing protein n=1 Tax=Bionectria ochroleuca TaxID=29856 RepID=A0A8H7KAJ0_BIOOC
MGSHTFKWEHPAEEVYVTGTFDNWTKSVKLEKDGDVFQKTVELEDASKKIYYKFVVDNIWTTNDSAPKEPDQDGNINNFLTPEQIITSPAAAALINTVTPDSTTAAMAGQQSKKKKNKKSKNNNKNKESQDSLATTETTQSKDAEEAPTPADIPGGFPITPAAELDRPVGINPLPAAEGAVNPVKVEAGEKIPQSVAAQDLNANVKLDKESYEKSDALPGGLPAAIAAEAEKPVSINPLPAAAGAVNPIQLAPGEKVPQSVAAQDINANVKLDKESYEKSDTLPGVQTEVPAVSKNIIPESGLPVGDATINSVTPTATTAILAGNVPLEPKVPKIVKESQEQAGVPPRQALLLKR